MGAPLKILFVCGRNQWRSPTAERIYKDDPRVSVRSAGVSGRSKHAVSAADLEWADLVLVMERHYVPRIRSDFGATLELPPIQSLDIPDEFNAMDPELVALIRSATEPHLASMNPRHSADPTPASGTPPAGSQARLC
jgi:predicted protein tyrosine phosphatase